MALAVALIFLFPFLPQHARHSSLLTRSDTPPFAWFSFTNASRGSEWKRMKGESSGHCHLPTNLQNEGMSVCICRNVRVDVEGV